MHFRADGEAPEFPRRVLDLLRQPLEAGEVVVARAAATVRFPARVLLVLAANPCPCVSAGGRARDCTCPPATLRRYRARLSGPLLDRVDLHQEVHPVARAELLADTGAPESTRVVAERVAAARERTRHRLRGTPWRTNAEVPAALLRGELAPRPGALRPVEQALERGELSARGLHRVARVAWTLADLAGSARPDAVDVAEALRLRGGVGTEWAA